MVSVSGTLISRENWMQDDDSKAIGELIRENRDLRDAIRLIVGRIQGIPWGEVPEREVEAYLRDIRRLKRASNL